MVTFYKLPEKTASLRFDNKFVKVNLFLIVTQKSYVGSESFSRQDLS
jgi:hypothetical protein